MQVTFIPLNDLEIQVERISDKTIFDVKNISIIYNPNDKKYYLNFDIHPTRIRDISIPISYLKEQENEFRIDDFETFGDRQEFSLHFKDLSDYSAAYFEAYNQKFNLYDVFSVSLFVSGKLKEKLK